MTTLAKPVGVPPRTAVIKNVGGNGLSKLITLTSVVLVVRLGLAAVPFGKWHRFVLALILALMVVAMIDLFMELKIGF